MVVRFMSRIRKAYEAKFRALLQRAGARRLEQGQAWLAARASGRAGRETKVTTEAWTATYLGLLRRAERWPAAGTPPSENHPPRFLCDVGLGALARWLRAAGYQAQWSAGITDDELVREAGRLRAVAVTTDSLLLERRVLREGEVRSVWVPPTLLPLEQLDLVLRELRLPLRPARCMHCGGELETVDKEAVRERIPPRTYGWLEKYFQCRGCGQLFWHGTHWQSIQEKLNRLGLEDGARECPIAKAEELG
jgi:uncharacterized protein